MVGEITQLRDTLKTAQKGKRRFYAAADVQDSLLFADGVGLPTRNVCLHGDNQHRVHPRSVEASIFSGACEAWRRYLSEGHSRGGPSHGGPFYTPRRKVWLPHGVCYKFSVVDLSWSRFRRLNLCLYTDGYTGFGRRYTGVMVSSNARRFDSNLNEIHRHHVLFPFVVFGARNNMWFPP